MRDSFLFFSLSFWVQYKTALYTNSLQAFQDIYIKKTKWTYLLDRYLLNLNNLLQKYIKWAK